MNDLTNNNSELKDNSKKFIEFAIENNVLCFGSFETKAKRLSPYFFNTGEFSKGDLLAKIGIFFAEEILTIERKLKIKIDCIFGPAYKGIPLVCSISIALTKYKRNIEFAYNRKEVKDHGEGGNIVGELKNKNILIIDDVISAGLSTYQAIKTIKENDGLVKGVLVALDRMEISTSLYAKEFKCASSEVCSTENIPVFSISNIHDLILFLEYKKQDTVDLKKYIEKWSNFY
jgi:orotate phosphoribosyltransferase